MSKRVLPFVDLAAKQARFTKRYAADLQRVMESGFFILGKEVEAFEQTAAKYTGAAHAIGLANGTDALVLPMKRMGIGPGDEVVTTPMTYLATVSSIALCGATAVFADIDDSLNLDADSVERAITPKTKAISVVHLAGIPARMDRLLAVAKKHNLEVIEDCAQSFGATFKGKHTGTFGRFGAISFHPLKNLGALGDGGMALARDPSDDAWLRQARNHGHKSRDECDFWTVNSRLDELQAAFLRTQIEDYPEELERRKKLAQIYRARLSGIVGFPEVAEGAEPSYNWIMVLADRREQLVTHLLENGIETKVHYPNLVPTLKAAAKNCREGTPYLNAKRQVERILSLPSAEHITEADVARVCDLIRAFYRA